MQVWMSRHGYRGDGAFGQYMVILPEHDAVIALFSCVEDMQAVLDAMWEHLLPAMGGEPLQGSAADDALLDRLAGLRLPTVAERIDAKPIERTALDGVPTMFTPGVVGEHSHRSVTSIEIDGQELVIRERESTLRLPLTADWRSDPGSAVSASAAAVADGRLAVDAVFLDTPHRLEIELDPATATFTANWWQLPLFGAGPPSMLANFKMPAD
ncbi:MAG: hypothetical protein R2710_26870, partial [Acidimicrobiales bacterium]